MAAARPDGVYGQRWKFKTVCSVNKRTTGDTIRWSMPRNQRLEPAHRDLIYNPHHSALQPNTARSEGY